MITDNLTALLSAAGVNVQAVKISDVSFNGKSLESAYAGMRSNAASMAEKVASDNQKQALALKEQADDELMQPLSNAYTQAAEIIADGQSEAASIIAPAYHKNPAFFDFFMSTKAGE
jgi:membrane protease subunit HflC